MATFRRIAAWKPLWVAAALALLYTLGGFFLVPYVIEREVPRLLHENLETKVSLGKVRFNPFLLELEANDFRLGGGEKPIVAFRRLFVNVAGAGLFRRTWTVSDIRLDALQVNAEIARDGQLNLLELAQQWSRHRPKHPDEPPPRVAIHRLSLTGAGVSFTDFSAPQRPSARVEAIDIDVADIATIGHADGHYELSAKAADGGTLSWRGKLSLEPIASAGEWRIERIKLATPWRFLREALRIAEPRGTVDFAGHYTFAYTKGTSALALSHMHARIAGLAIALEGEREPLAALEKIQLADARFDLAKRELIVPRLDAANGSVAASVSPGGELDWQRIAKANGANDPNAAHSAIHPSFYVRADQIAVDNVKLRFADRTRRIPVEYSAHASGRLTLDVASGKEQRIVADAVHVALNDGAIVRTDTAEALVRVKALEVGGGRIDAGGHSVVLESIALKGADAQLVREKDGRFALPDAFVSAQPSGPPAVKRDSAASRPWKYQIAAADITNARIAYIDRSFKPALRYDLDIGATLKSIASGARSPIGISAAVRVAQGGTLNAAGTLAQDFTAADLKVDATGVRAEPLQPVLARYTILDLKSGSASAAARVAYRSAARPAWQVHGRGTVQDLLVNERDTGDRFASWKALNADGVALTLAPNALLVKDVRIDEPGAKLVIFKDRSMNVTHVMKRDAAPAAAVPTSDEVSDAFPVRVARVALRKGTVDYADDSLVLPFATRVTSLDGAIVGLSSSPRSRAELKLEGEIAPNGQARAEGSLRPADPKSFLDIDVRFDNVEMAPLSPYTATFAGRKIAAGRLWVDVHYKIANSQLLGENKITLADFALGERVKAPDAVDLPLDLAIALLKEPDGRIHLAVPVRGDLDNPQFDYGVLIRDAITNTLARIATAPFRFLANLFGGSGEELQNVEFDAGSAELLPSEREQLQKVAAALKEKHQLKLVVHGAYAPQRDGQALRDRAVRLALSQALDVKLAPGEDPGPVAFDDPDAQRALEKLMIARAGENAVDAFAAEYRKSTGNEPRRVNPVLALIHRGRGARAFYEALFEKLVQLEPLPDSVLTDLADRRARVIADFVARTGIDAARVEMGKIGIAQDKSQPIAAKLALQAT